MIVILTCNMETPPYTIKLQSFQFEILKTYDLERLKWQERKMFGIDLIQVIIKHKECGC